MFFPYFQAQPFFSKYFVMKIIIKIVKNIIITNPTILVSLSNFYTNFSNIFLLKSIFHPIYSDGF